MSNNSPKEFSIHEARENVSDHILEILDGISNLIKSFYVSVKIQEDLTIVTLQEIETTGIKHPFRVINLTLFSKPKSYLMILFHHSDGNKNPKKIYEIKVKGDYEVNVLKTNLEKLIKGENLSHRPRFYPF